jgi:hypothetical protein
MHGPSFRIPVPALALVIAVAGATSSFAASLDLGVGGAGLSVGSSQRWTGLRLNWRDVDVDRVTGLNLTVLGGERATSPVVRGLSLGGSLTGITLGGLAAGAGETATGLVAGGLAAGAGTRILGIGASVAYLRAPEITGLALTGGYLHTDVLRGVAVAGHCRAEAEQRGLAIGVVNTTPRLHGVQIGLLNHAGNNPSGLRWLPLLNAHF